MLLPLRQGTQLKDADRPESSKGIFQGIMARQLAHRSHAFIQYSLGFKIELVLPACGKSGLGAY